jgi:protease I
MRKIWQIFREPESLSWQLMDLGHSVSVDRTIDEIGAGDYDALVLPGGQINPDLLCMIVESST